jgi:hypothetical protein
VHLRQVLCCFTVLLFATVFLLPQGTVMPLLLQRLNYLALTLIYHRSTPFRFDFIPIQRVIDEYVLNLAGVQESSAAAFDILFQDETSFALIFPPRYGRSAQRFSSDGGDHDAEHGSEAEEGTGTKPEAQVVPVPVGPPAEVGAGLPAAGQDEIGV